MHIKGSSMEPNFKNKDIILYSKSIKNINYGDVIIFEKNNKYYIKRIYGKPNDKVEILKNNYVLINDQPMIIPNLMTIAEPSEATAHSAILQNNEYYVLGDNRIVSIDSRNKDLDAIKEDEIVGVYKFTLNSFITYNYKKRLNSYNTIEPFLGKITSLKWYMKTHCKLFFIPAIFNKAIICSYSI